MITIVRTAVFDRRLARMKDVRGKAMILKGIRSAERGNLGDCRSVGSGVVEMRIHVGPGYRLYFARKGDLVYVLLCAGSKSHQQRDIVRARTMVRQLKLD